MASSHQVQSRTAINALRGVLLTTSCSVILLAEERRQRLKIARAALENAKKLHTVRVNHNSVALGETFGRREVYPVELGVDFSSTSLPRNTVRRRRRNGQPSPTPLRAETIEPKDNNTLFSPETPETRRKKWDEWDAARKELSRISSLGPSAHHELFLRVSMDEITTASNHGPSRTSEHDTDTASEPAAARSSRLIGKLIPESLGNPTSKNAAQHKPMIETASPAKDTGRPGAQGSPKQSLVTLDGLIAELNSPGADRAMVAEGQDSAIELLDGLISSQFLEPRSSMSRGLTILQSVLNSQERSKIPVILDTLRPVCKETCLLAVPAMDCLHAKHDAKGANRLLHHLFHSPIWKSEDTPHNLRNPWVTRMLMHYWRKTQNFSEIKSIYRLLQDAGLFADGFLPVLSQYSIRRRVALIALDAGDDLTARLEMERLRQLRPKAADNDVKLQGRFAIRDAVLGNWKMVWPQVQGLKTKGNTDDQYQNVLSWLTKIYCKDHSPEEVDIFVRDLVITHEMSLNQPLAFLVMDRHGRNRDTQALVKWLQFCHNSGLEANQIFFNEVVNKCCKYWNFARVDVVHMLKGVRGFKPWVHDPHVAKYSVRGALIDLHKSLPGEDLKGDVFGTVSKLPNTRGDSLTVFERNAFRCMNTWALENKWLQVYDAFKEASDKGVGFSSRCLRLAVIANINLEGPHSRTASELVGKAHVEGHDVSGALVPLLVARLESGDSVGALLQEALSQGTHVHDSVYNKAARILTQKGLQIGAIRVCELAAQQNGKGELAYSQYNFASLVFLYTGQRRYGDLQSLIRSFTCKSEWWQGSKECKESLKRAIKAVATRVARSPPTDREMHEEVLTYLKQALEHIKVSRAASRQDRVILTEEVVGVFKAADETGDLDHDVLEEEAPVDRRPHSARMLWEAPTARSRSLGQLDEGVQQERPAKMERSKSLRGGKAEPQLKAVRASETANEQEDIFMAKYARQSLAGAVF